MDKEKNKSASSETSKGDRKDRNGNRSPRSPRSPKNKNRPSSVASTRSSASRSSKSSKSSSGRSKNKSPRKTQSSPNTPNTTAKGKSFRLKNMLSPISTRRKRAQTSPGKTKTTSPKMNKTNESDSSPKNKKKKKSKKLLSPRKNRRKNFSYSSSTSSSTTSTSKSQAFTKERVKEEKSFKPISEGLKPLNKSGYYANDMIKLEENRLFDSYITLDESNRKIKNINETSPPPVPSTMNRPKELSKKKPFEPLFPKSMSIFRVEVLLSQNRHRRVATDTENPVETLENSKTANDLLKNFSLGKFGRKKNNDLLTIICLYNSPTIVVQREVLRSLSDNPNWNHIRARDIVLEIPEEGVVFKPNDIMTEVSVTVRDCFKKVQPARLYIKSLKKMDEQEINKIDKPNILLDKKERIENVLANIKGMISVSLPNGVLIHVSVYVSELSDINSLKLRVWNDLKLHPRYKQIFRKNANISDYILIKSDDSNLKLDQLERRISSDTHSFIRPIRNINDYSLIPKSEPVRSNTEKVLNMNINYILENPTTLNSTNGEIDVFRISAVRLREQVNSEKSRIKNQNSLSFPVKLTSYKLPSILTKRNLRIVINHADNISEELSVKITSTPKNILALLKSKYPKWFKTSGDWILKLRDFYEFLVSDIEFKRYEVAQNCLMQNERFYLSLIDKKSLELFSDKLPKESVIKDSYESLFNEYDIASRLGGKESGDKNRNEEYDYWENLVMFSLFDLKHNFRLRLRGVDGLKSKSNSNEDSSDLVDNSNIYVFVGIYFGDELLAAPCFSKQVPYSTNPRWDEWLNFDIHNCDIPKETVLSITVFESKSSQDVALGWINVRLIDFQNHLKTGNHTYKIWPNERANPIGTCMENPTSSLILALEFDSYSLPVVFPVIKDKSRRETHSHSSSKIDSAEQEKVDKLINCDPLHILSMAEQHLLWKNRVYCSKKPEALPKLLRSVNWAKREHVIEAEKLLNKWAPCSPAQALELLDARFAAEFVREYAVNALESLSDSDLDDYLLQLVQALQFEMRHDSVLARFLLRRALLSRPRIGHSFFWHLKSNLHLPETRERFELILEAYLRGCGDHLNQLKNQVAVCEDLVKVANIVKKYPISKAKEVLQEELRKLKLPKKFQLPLFSSFVSGGINIESCKVMDSKKMPLWISFRNHDKYGKPILVIFKVGDDLRQDALTLQLFSKMSKFWLQDGLDLYIANYRAVPTGDMTGMLEVVQNSETLSGLQKQMGGSKAAFDETSTYKWLRQFHSNDEEYNTQVVDNFIRSCAGACVSTFLLGVTDRHNDNIMIKRTGHLFHIDFGHFLGRVKTFGGVSRERCPFVFTPDMAFIMGRKNHPDYSRFEKLCCAAYNSLRKHSSTFMTLLTLMISTGIPELTRVEDIFYLRDAFSLDLTEEEASENMIGLISQCLSTKSTQLNFYVHSLVH